MPGEMVYLIGRGSWI